MALRTLREHAPDAYTLGDALGLPRELAARVYPGWWPSSSGRRWRTSASTSRTATATVPTTRRTRTRCARRGRWPRAWPRASLPPFIGIRIKPLSGELYARSLRTLDLFVTALALQHQGASWPPHFVVTIPKVTIPEHVSTVATLAGALERKLRLPRGVLKLELMVETPQSIFDEEGRAALRALVAEGGGRVRGAHFGTYDYTASCNITAAHQSMTHPACDFAKHVMQVAPRRLRRHAFGRGHEHHARGAPPRRARGARS